MIFHDYFYLLEYLSSRKTREIKGTTMRESVGIQLTINDPKKCLFYIDELRPFDYVAKYLHGELSWFMSGERTIDYIVKYSKFWEKVCDENREVNSNYGWHVYYKELSSMGRMTNYQNCLNLLLSDLMSRQAIMLYNEPDLLFNNPKDLVCTQTQQFICRDGKLDSIVYIRSSDAIFGLTYDIPWWSLVQQHLAMDLNVGLGKLIINIGSSHVYERFYDLVEKFKHSQTHVGSVELIKPVGLHNTFYFIEENLDKCIEIKN